MLRRTLETRYGVLETRSRAVETLSRQVGIQKRIVETLSRQVETQNRAVETLSGALETHFRGIETRLFCLGERLKLFFRYSEYSFERSRPSSDHSNDFSLRLKASDDHFKDHFPLSKNFWGRFNRARIQFYLSELFPNRQFLLSHESLLLLRCNRAAAAGRLLLIVPFASSETRTQYKSCTNFFATFGARKIIIMELNLLTAITPIDGRYRSKVENLQNYFSEYALIKYRVLVEVEYFIALCELPLPQLAGFDQQLFGKLRQIAADFSVDDAQRVKDIEKVTNHDVKAVEYFLKEEFDKLGIQAYKEFIHFGLTSQDINNTAVPKSIQDALDNEYYPAINDLTDTLDELADEWKDVSMLAKTHGQPASPTSLGKEIRVFAERIKIQLEQLKSVTCDAKFGGATGNFNAHQIAYPEISWKAFGNHFLKKYLGLERAQYTTQIANYDNHAAIFDALKRINTIILDLDRDLWTYISMEYFKQKIKAGEVGSSAMPHKVNPIDFENSEGNIGIANALLEHLAAKLPVSRLQRDLTDSTVLRTIGMPLGHTLIAVSSTLKGLGKLLLNKEAIDADLEKNWAVVAEAIQTILRREAYPNPYEALRNLTRTNKKMSQEVIHEFIDTLEISDELKAELKTITPHNYTGIFS